MSDDAGLPADAPAEIGLEGPTIAARGFLTYEQYRVHLAGATLKRDVVRIGRVVGILCFDPARDLVVLIRQFRLAAQLSAGRGDMIELPAGRVDAGEDWETAAARECREETGLVPRRLSLIHEIMPSPGVLDEHCRLFLGEVDAERLPRIAGLASENEVTHPFALPVPDALRLLEDGRCLNGYLLLALQWLALRRLQRSAGA